VPGHWTGANEVGCCSTAMKSIAFTPMQARKRFGACHEFLLQEPAYFDLVKSL